MGGLLPFGSIFIEMYFVFTSFWNYKASSSFPLTTLKYQHAWAGTFNVAAHFEHQALEQCQYCCLPLSAEEISSSFCTSLLPRGQAKSNISMNITPAASIKVEKHLDYLKDESE